jgi:FkbM family methyltransferase
LNAGAYIGRKDFIINVFEEVLKYVTDHDLPAKKWYHYETFMPKGQELNIVKNIAENFPKGCGSDQAILRHIEKQFYPNLMLDTQKKIFARIGVKLGYEHTQRNVFIDCGAHRGQSIRKFLTTRQYKENLFEIWSFEPNFELIKEFAHRARKMKNIRIIPQAVWFEDKEMNFYLDRNDGDGSSLLKEKKHPSGFKENDLDNPLKAYAFDFSAWVLNNFSPDDYIIVKMDIEGAEYGVLAKMIADGALDYVNELYIEWHHEKVNIPKEVHDALVEKIKSMSIVLRGEFLKGAEHLKYR